ncbi:ureidoglycolate lyase [Xylophilus sp. GW821-FHT01B05]
MNTLQAQPLTREAFAPFGEALLVPQDTGLAINGGSAQRFDAQSPPDLLAQGGAPCLTLFRTAGPEHAAPWSLRLLERHALGSQTFVPLGSGRCLAVVAPSAADGSPNEAQLQAFVVEPGQGITLRRGTWHHPLLTLGPIDVLVLERRGPVVDCDLVPLRQAWRVSLAG